MGKHQFSKNFHVTIKNDGQRKSYNQHDDRDGGPSISSGRGRGGTVNRVWRRGDSKGRHVSFNDRGGGGIRKRHRGGGGGGLRTDLIIDDDQNMSGSRGSQSGRARPAPGSVRGKRGRGRGRGRGAYISGGYVLRKGPEDGSGGWQKVMLMNASRWPKEEVLAALVNAIPTVAPLCFVKQGMNYVFYVETRQQAVALTNVDNQVPLGDGSLLKIKADPSAPPQMTLTDEAMEKIKVVMSNRYTPTTKALDLKAFHADRAFLGEAVYAPLYRGACMKRVVQVIQDNIPEIEAVDLSENRLPTLDAFATLVGKATNIKTLFLSKNKINDIKELISIRGFKLENLNVEGNPFVNRYMDHDHLVRNVRKIFPTLKILNGKDLPKVIGFEGDDDESTSGGLTALPPVQSKMTVNPSVENIIIQFLQEYFKVYDSGNREPLMNAYHEEALMSMCTAYPPWQLEGPQRLNEYLTRSRNLLRITDSTRRRATLRQGRLAVVSFLNELPKSSHDMASFTLDVTLATEGVMSFSVTGVFREVDHSEPVIRHFTRMFVVVPQGGGFCIVNESLFVTAATRLQVKNAFTDGTNLGGASAAASPGAPAANSPDANTIRSMIEAMSQKSGMNAEWSKKCLEQTNWNFDDACAAFKTASSEGKIPIEAFER